MNNEKSIKLKSNSNIPSLYLKEKEDNKSYANIIERLENKAKSIKNIDQCASEAMRLTSKQKTYISKKIIQCIDINQSNQKKLGESKESSNVSLFHFTSDDEIRRLSSKKDIQDDIFYKIKNEMEDLFEYAMKEYFIDSKHNLPEYYEEYVIQNLKVIKRMLFFFNQPVYDEQYNRLCEKINNEQYLSFVYNSYIKNNKDAVINHNYDYIFIDLDETLIHSEPFVKSKEQEYDKTLSIEYFDKSEMKSKIEKIGIFIRPFSTDFLSYLKKHNFRLVLFTAAENEYARLVLTACELIDYFDFILDRDFTIKFNNFYIKDLAIFNYNEKLNCLIIDNNIFSFCTSLQQGILISSFYENKLDEELKDMIDYFANTIIPNRTKSIIEANDNNYMYHDLMLKLDFDTNVTYDSS